MFFTNKFRVALLALPALFLLANGVATESLLPGIYFDGVNPDWLVAPILNPNATIPSGATLPGNALLDKFPLLTQIYHGTLPIYVGLPFYALFGTDVLGIRETHGVFAGLVLVSFFALLISFDIAPWLAAVLAAALALDPAFLFSFRDQFYITVLPVAFLFFSAAAVNLSARAAQPTQAARRLFVSGALAGIACFGYFVHVFFAAAIFFFSAFRANIRLGIYKRVSAWLAGLGAGLLPYIIGFGLVALSLHSIGAAVGFVKNSAVNLEIGKSSETILQRAGYGLQLFVDTVLNSGNEDMMFHATLPKIGEVARLVILFGIPLGTLIASELARRGNPALRLAAGFVAANFVMCLCFGSRLWIQHIAPLVPIFYLGLAGATALIIRAIPVFVGRTAALAGLAVLLYLNVLGQQTVFAELRRTGGVGIMSDAINRFADDAVADAKRSFYAFPDWGLMTQIFLITRGEALVRPDVDIDLMRRELCQGRNVVIAYFPEAEDNREKEWIERLGLGEPQLTVYRQRNGAELIRVLRWRSDLQHALADCAREKKPAAAALLRGQ